MPAPSPALVLPLSALQAFLKATAAPTAAGSSDDDARLPFGVLLGIPADGDGTDDAASLPARVAHVWPAVAGVSLAELVDTLPSGLAPLGCVAAAAAHTEAAVAFLTSAASAAVMPASFHVITLAIPAGAAENASAASSPAASTAPADSAAVSIARSALYRRASSSSSVSSSDATGHTSIDASASAADLLSELPVFHASFLCSWHGSTVGDFLARCDELAKDLAAADNASTSASESRFAWLFADKGVAPAFRGRVLLAHSGSAGDSEDNDANDGLDATAWSLLSEDSPLIARKKAATKAAASSSGKGSSAAAAASAASSAGAIAPPLPIADHAVELSLLARSVPPAVAAVSAPTLRFSACNGPLRTLTLKLSVLHYASSPSQSLRSVLACLRKALQAQLALARQRLEEQLSALLKAVGADSRALTLQALHFQPLSLPHALTVLYLHEALPSLLPFDGAVEGGLAYFPPPPSEELRADGTEEPHPAHQLAPQEQRLKAQRARLHQLWHLRRDTPAFRFVNVVALPSLSATHLALGVRDPADFIIQPRLFDVHTALPPLPQRGSSASSAMTHVVSGRYGYYHYLQDRQSDSGWGCAYRTAQSLCSFALLGGWVVERPVPSIRDMQRLLVDVGDKAPRFAGSAEWIGSTEVALVLRAAYGLQCKTLFVSSGAEVGSAGSGVARQLAAHFERQGTPVMIGGGVLAYGLLGVSIDSATGEAKFLILDPHYTGADSAGLAPILKGAWVGWKSADLFLPQHYYNFAMLQRPEDSI
jgi:hypothetical protein